MKNSTTLENGFTLVEILIVSSLTLLVGGGILGLIVILGENRISTFENYLGVETVNNNISEMVREVRNARYGDNGAYTLDTADDQEFIFYSDIDYDGDADKIRYTLTDSILEKGITKPVGFPAIYNPANEIVKVVAENIRNGVEPVFYYYNGDWPSDTTNNPLPSPTRLSETKLMKIHLRINKYSSPGVDDFMLESYVQLRSLKQNL